MEGKGCGRSSFEWHWLTHWVPWGRRQAATGEKEPTQQHGTEKRER